MKDYQGILNDVTQRVQKKIEEKQAEGKLKITGTAFEAIVYEELVNAGIRDENIKHSTRKFPDFVLSDDVSETQIGLEVKKTNEDKWKVPGGSVYESLRNQIEETYVLMGKLGGIPEAKLRKYEECIDDLKVTHSPRFLLDLNLKKGTDYLTKNHAEDLLDLSFGPELNKRIRELLRTSKDTWYSEETVIAFSELDAEEKEHYFVDGIVLFPEVTGGNYANFAPWMIYKCLVWCGNIRDVFSAGGIVLYDGLYISAVMNRIFITKKKILQRISQMTVDELKKHWNMEPCDLEGRIEKWIDLISKNIKISNRLVNKNKESKRLNDKKNKDIRKQIIEEFIEKLRADIWILHQEIEENE